MPEVIRRAVGDVTLAVRSWRCAEPSRTAVVLIPGTGATAADWDAVAADLRRDRDVFALDLRGHGGSDWTGRYSITLMADDVAGIVPTLAPQVDVVGHSLGGLVGCQVAARPASGVRRLVLEDVGVLHPRPPAPPSRPDGDLEFDWKVVEQVRPQIDDPDPGWPDLLRRIDVPVLAVSGGATSFVPPAHVADLADIVPDATVVTIEAGHHIHASRPDEFLSTVRAFLDD